MITREWAAIHRKHHAKCETEEDPHSPQIKGIGTVFWRGVELYREARADRESIEKYGKGCPDDWIERNLYSRWPTMGPTLLRSEEHTSELQSPMRHSYAVFFFKKKI